MAKGIKMSMKQDWRLKKNLKKLTAMSKNLTPLMKQIGIYMLASTNKTFTKEGRPKWIELSKETKICRARIGKWPGKMLQVTGRLKGSITFKASKDNVLIGTSVPYASRLQFGDSSMGMPPRPFLQFLSPDEKNINKITESYLQRQIKRLS